MASDSGHGGDTYRLAGTRGWGFAPDRTALLVIDPVNDFLFEGGAGWEMTKSTVTKHDVVGHLQPAIEAARAHGPPQEAIGNPRRRDRLGARTSGAGESSD